MKINVNILKLMTINKKGILNEEKMKTNGEYLEIVIMEA